MSQDEANADAALNAPEPSWTLLRGWLEQPERPVAWREAGLWALEVLERELGGRWPERTSIKFGRLTGPIVLSGTHVFAYTELLELALRLQLVRSAHEASRLTKLMKRTVQPMDMAHLRVQLEVAGFAIRDGWNVAFEPVIAGSSRRGDLLLDRNGEQVLVECAAMGRSDIAVETDEWMRQVADELRLVHMHRGVGVTAAFTDQLDNDATQALLEYVHHAAAFVSAGGIAPPHRVPGALVELHADRDIYEINGPPHTVDYEKKLRMVIEAKAVQTFGELSAWICIHSLDGLFWGEEWNASPLEPKLSFLADLCVRTLADHQHVAGVVLSNGASLVDLRRDNDHAELASGARALRQHVPPVRYREAYILPVATAEPPAFRFWDVSFSDEPGWLPWALSTARLPSREAIFATGS